MSDISINRNAVLSTLNENNQVSEEHKRTLEIFLNAKRVVDSRRSPVLKGSFLDLDENNYMHKLHSGYEIYIAALPELMKVYECNINNYEHVLSVKLAPFYREISAQNKKEIFEMRVLSLLNGFRHSIASLPESLGNTNLNILPELFFKIYKILFVVMMAVFLIFTALYLLKLKKKNLLQYYPALIILVQVLYFPVVNFLYITESNANRFKFPGEPLIIGLTIFYLSFFFRRKSKRSINDLNSYSAGKS